jgi:hypothetical protein
MNACLSPCDNLQSVKSQSVKSPRGVPPTVPHVQSSKVPSVVPSEAIRVQSCAPSQWHTVAPFAVLPRVLSQTPISPGVSLVAPPSEFPMGVSFEALPVHAYSAPPEVLHSHSCAPAEGIHSQSCAPAEGVFELTSSSVPPEALPVQSWAPSKGPSKTPSSSPCEAPPTPNSAPFEAPLHPEVSPETPQAEAVASKLRH